MRAAEFYQNEIMGHNPVLVSKQINTDLEKIVMSNSRCIPDTYRFSENAFDEYKSIVQNTIDESKDKGSYAIVVDKLAKVLDLYKAGEKISSYPVDLGLNPIDDKFMEGDRCTPEGIYHISVRKEVGESIFHKALLIDYPKKRDLDEFKQLKKDGKVLPLSTVGGDIEIHGDGTGGKADWTYGCIALANPDIDNLFSHPIGRGTPVCIVRYGSRDSYCVK